MAMGKVLAASEVGGHRELIRHNETGILFPTGDASALMESLKKLLDDQVFCQKLGENGAAWVRQKHTWEKTTAVYPDIYAKAMVGSNSTSIRKNQVS
jgi:Glycosyltransferase